MKRSMERPPPTNEPVGLLLENGWEPTDKSIRKILENSLKISKAIGYSVNFRTEVNAEMCKCFKWSDVWDSGTNSLGNVAVGKPKFLNRYIHELRRNVEDAGIIRHEFV